jgi:hypothetical protein
MLFANADTGTWTLFDRMPDARSPAANARDHQHLAVNGLWRHSWLWKRVVMLDGKSCAAAR